MKDQETIYKEYKQAKTQYIMSVRDGNKAEYVRGYLRALNWVLNEERE